jgi:hypothetical protein
MGRQIQVLMSIEDEAELVAHLQSTCEIQIFESFSPTAGGLLVDAFNPTFVGHWHYKVWNKRFGWTPEYGTVGPNAHNPEHIGWKYVCNSGAGPVLEITRSSPDLKSTGRLYWASGFSAPNGLSYDREEFGRWVDSVWRWVRKNRRKSQALPLKPYVLRHALSRVT